jgi:hypothetical protein
MKWPWSAPSPRPRFKEEPDPVAPDTVLCIAVLALKFKREDSAYLTWSWSTADDEAWALGSALKTVPAEAAVVGKTVIRVAVASGMEAPSGGETEGLDPQDDSPTAEGGDAQTEGE